MVEKKIKMKKGFSGKQMINILTILMFLFVFATSFTYAVTQINPYENFRYRNLISLNQVINESNRDYYDFVVNIDTKTLISLGKMKSDCSDIRFSDNDGVTLLNYNLNAFTCNTNSTYFKARVPKKEISTENLTDEYHIYAYFGNPTMNSDLNNSIGVTNGLSPGFLTESVYSTYHRCYIDKIGDVYCVGDNTYGQLGDGTATVRYSPVKVVGLDGATIQVVVNNVATCALLQNGSVYCWGYGGNGQLGNGGSTTYYTPVKASIDNVTQLAGNGVQAFCGLKSDGKLYCWGYGPYGDIGDGLAATSTLNPTLVSEGAGLIQGDIGFVTGGYYSFCAITKSTKKAFCWGYEQYGQLGDGIGSRATVPSKVATPEFSEDAVYIAPIHFGYCGIKSDGSLYCWGYGGYYLTGLGSANNYNYPVDTGLDNVVQVLGSSDQSATCAITKNMQMYCWGHSQTIPGWDPGYGYLTTPVLITEYGEGLDNPIALGSSYGAFCGVNKNLSVYCWGFYNAYGTMGIGNITVYPNPKYINSLSAGYIHNKKPTSDTSTLQIPDLQSQYYMSDSINISIQPEQTWISIGNMDVSNIQIK